MLAIFVYSVSMLVVVLVEKRKAKKVFETLPEDAKNNFRNHTNAIGRVKDRIKRIRDNKDSDLNFY